MSEHERPETYAAYHAVAKLRGAGDACATVLGLKQTGLDVHFSDGEVLHYDLEGRLLRVARPNVQWRRGLSGRTLRVRRRTFSEGGSLERIHVDSAEADSFVQAAQHRMHALLRSPAAGSSTDEIAAHALMADVSVANGEVLPVGPQNEGGNAQAAQHQLARIARNAAEFDVPASHADVASFRSLYHDIPILPPDQYTSLVLLASDGCRYNKCTFCDFYRDVPYRTRPIQQFQEHVEQAIAYHGAALAARRHIFLGQANALMGPPAWREEILEYVNERFELPAPDSATLQVSWWKGFPLRFTGITSFLDAFIGARIEADEFARMRQLNLRQIFIGLESGCSALLDWLRKPSDTTQMLATVRAAKQAGVVVGVIVLVGAGGERHFDTHVRDTVELIRAMELESGDFVYLSPLVSAGGAEYDAVAEADGIAPLTAARMAEQEQQLRAGIGSSPSRQGPYVAHYEVEHFVY